MSREKYNAEKEHEIIGMYPAIKGMELAGGGDSKLFEVPEYPRFYRPIDTRENFKMLFRGETPYWMVNNGWVFCDINEFRPRQTPDCIAHHQCLDGGPYIDYSKRPKITKGWFGLELEMRNLYLQVQRQDQEIQSCRIFQNGEK